MGQLAAGMAGIVLLIYACAWSQIDTAWTKLIGTGFDDYALDGQQTADGGYILAGYSHTANPDTNKIYVAKLNAVGDTVWTRSYGGTGSDMAFAVTQTKDNGFAVAGRIRPPTQPLTYKRFLMKLSLGGDTLWNRITKYHAPLSYSMIDEARCIIERNDGSLLVPGLTIWLGELMTTREWFTAAGDSLAPVVWSGKGIPQKIKSRAKSGYVLLGNTSQVDTASKIAITHLDSSAKTVVRSVTFRPGTALFSATTDFDELSNGGLLMCGYEKTRPGNSSNSYDAFAMATDSNFTVQWTRYFDDGSNEFLYSMTKTTGGTYLLSGCNEKGLWLMEMSSAGDTLWTKSFGGTVANRANRIMQTADGGYLTFGQKRSNRSGQDYDIWLLKLSSAERDTAKPSVILKSPLPGAKLAAGGMTTIAWSSGDNSGISARSIYLKKGGPSWILIDSAASSAADSAWSWLVPSDTAANCRLKMNVYDFAGNCGSDTTDGPFTIANLPHFTSPESIQVQTDSTLLYQITFDNPIGGSPVLTYLTVPPSWVSTAGNYLTGMVPIYAGEDTVIVALSVGDVTYDTLAIRIRIVGTTPHVSAAEQTMAWRMDAQINYGELVISVRTDGTEAFKVVTRDILGRKCWEQSVPKGKPGTMVLRHYLSETSEQRGSGIYIVSLNGETRTMARKVLGMF